MTNKVFMMRDKYSASEKEIIEVRTLYIRIIHIVRLSLNNSESIDTSRRPPQAESGKEGSLSWIRKVTSQVSPRLELTLGRYAWRKVWNVALSPVSQPCLQLAASFDRCLNWTPREADFSRPA